MPVARLGLAGWFKLPPAFRTLKLPVGWSQQLQLELKIRVQLEVDVAVTLTLALAALGVP